MKRWLVPTLLLTLAVGVQPAIDAVAIGSPGRSVAVASPSESPAASETPAPSESPAPSEPPSASESPAPSELPSASESPAPGESPSASESPGACQTVPAVPVPDEPISMPQEVRLGLFDAVWQSIDQAYVDEGHNGVDWASIRASYQPEVIDLDDSYRVYALLQDMVSQLQDPYTVYLNPLQVQGAGVPNGAGGIAALLDTSEAATTPGLRILYAFPGGPAAKAGVRSRDLLLSVDGDPCVSIDKVRGPIGSSVTFSVQSPGGEPRDVTIERGPIPGVALPTVERLGPRGSIGYLRLATLTGQKDAVTQALRALSRRDDVNGLILDLRSTSLGAAGSLVDVLGQFVDGSVGSVYTRSGDQPVSVQALGLKRALDKLPVVVLVDERTVGEAEELAAIMQAQKRATIVGQQTTGRSDLSRSADYPDGSRIMVVTAGFQLSDGTRLQDHGITPDVPVDGDWLQVSEKNDPYLKKAIQVLRNPRSTR